MALPITVPFTFGNATTTQSLSSLDADFSTVYNAVNGIGNGTVSLSNVSITGGSIAANITATGIFSGTSNVSITSTSGPVSINTNGTNAVYIDASQNVGIGTTSPTLKATIEANGAQLRIRNTTTRYRSDYAVDSAGTSSLTTYDDTGAVFKQMNIYASPLTFNTTSVGAETMRIDSSGNVLIGGSVQVWDERELVRSDTNTVKLGIYGSSTSFTSSMIRAQVETAAGAGWYFFEGRSSGGLFQYGIRGNGTVATSDERRKKNIEPARSYIDDICKIRVVNYNWKSDEDTTPKELGWIAQEVAEVFPNMVVTHHDGPNDDQEVLLLKKEVFVPMLMKCIQELSAKNDALEARLVALEAK